LGLLARLPAGTKTTYSHAWSWGLLLYLSSVELVVTGIVVWGLGLLAAATVPRLA